MLVFAVVSPEVFREDCFKEDGYQAHLRSFLRDTDSNIVLLLDPDGTLLDETEKVIESLPIKYRQNVEIWLTDLRSSLRHKKSRRRLVKCAPDTCNTNTNQSSLGRCERVAAATLPDTLFLSDTEMSEIQSRDENTRAARMGDYIGSDFDEKRRYYINDLAPIDLLASSEFDDLIIRATKYSVWLRFYDSYIGKATSNFKEGIRRILKLWIDNAHFPPDRIEIITAVQNENVPLVTNKLLKPLYQEFKIEIDLRIIKDPEKKFHSRFLQSQTAAILFERGFDFVRMDGSLKRALVALKNGVNDQSHLNEMRNLEGCIVHYPVSSSNE